VQVKRAGQVGVVGIAFKTPEGRHPDAAAVTVMADILASGRTSRLYRGLVDKGLVNMVRSMGSSEWQTFFKVRLPAALPSIFGGLKVAVSLAVIGAIIGEYIAAERGLGYLQLQANSQFDTTLNFATVVTISLVGVLLFYAVAFVEAKVAHERESSK
jgi:ABC-type nitrate/sulfonate/bicarbonate transport system permease component